MENIITEIVIGTIVFIIYVFVVRWIFKISEMLTYQKEQLEYQKKQYMMLRLMAAKAGVEKDYIMEIDDHAGFHRNKRLAEKAAAGNNAKSEIDLYWEKKDAEKEAKSNPRPIE